MKTVLRIDTSVFGEAGVSSQLNAFAVDQLRLRFDPIRVLARDLHREPLAHYDGELAQATRVAPGDRNERDQLVAGPADEVIEQALAADVWLIGAPMYNFGMPSTLKAWFDHLLRAGTTFRYTSAGPEGLIAARPVIVTASRGGIYPAEAGDFVVPHIRNLLNFVGLQNIHVVYAEGLNMGHLDSSLAAAKSQLTDLIQSL